MAEHNSASSSTNAGTVCTPNTRTPAYTHNTRRRLERYDDDDNRIKAAVTRPVPTAFRARFSGARMRAFSSGRVLMNDGTHQHSCDRHTTQHVVSCTLAACVHTHARPRTHAHTRPRTRTRTHTRTQLQATKAVDVR